MAEALIAGAGRARQRLALYARLARFDRPIGVLLLLWPTLTALWIAARGFPGWLLLFVFVAGTLLTRSAGCAVNDIADRRFDLHVERTAQRVLTSGAVSVREAWWVAAILGALAAALLPLMDAACFPLALVAVGVTLSYPLFKRFFPMPQAYLGIAFSFGIPMAFAAVDGGVSLEGWALFAANLLWVVAYDTEYAMVDRNDDLRIGIRSSAILFGSADVAIVMGCYAAYLAAMAWIGADLRMGLPYLGGLALAAGCAVYHYVLIRRRDRAGCLRAFLHNHWFGAAVFAGVAADLALRR
ncbi:MAG TPA: 4-hydroxybenzoate octaprenyltransferase [Burkholderiaceae bacterium]|nr:4-hydroxybenzoate octaprenyltransferase [Burkholderiaceae bacterium]